ncbi:MAG: Lrp/AsnC ligand binding domain-containing protein [Chloroflexi bacterium]|nr:Lrp/AsnC ligand binding domain-containing protein [Chloroflexota bacterium]
MGTRAFILIETSVGKTQDVVAALRLVPQIQAVDAVTGPYDVIAIVDAPDLNTVGNVVTSSIHTIAGILRTVTCLAVSLG